MPSLYIIGGANGSGKTTVSLNLLPNRLGVFEYVNADAIASALSPFNPESAALQAGRLMLERLQYLSDSGVDFSFETTLAARSYRLFLESCKNKGYSVNLLYFWLNTPDLAVERVARRVASGGHSIPEDTIRRRYERGRKNLVDLYIPIADTWMVLDNSTPQLMVVAERLLNQEAVIYNQALWQLISGGEQ